MNELPEHWIKIRTLEDPFQANLVKGLLEEQKIPVVFIQDGNARVFGFNPISPVEIFVAPESEAETRKLINEYFSGGKTEGE